MLHGGVRQRIGTLALAREPNIIVNNIYISRQHVFLLLKSNSVDVDDEIDA
jgi:hypothetical protein